MSPQRREDGASQPAQPVNTVSDKLWAKVMKAPSDPRYPGNCKNWTRNLYGTAAALAKVCAVLAGFDWETSDRQHALEKIERIAAAEAGRIYTHPDVFTLGVEQGWAEAETDPARIDWPARQSAALIPFQVIDGRPVNPCEKTSVRYGRNEMGFWGEQQMADALVTFTSMRGERHLLMIERGDSYGWAVPGGHVEPGETGTQAAVRELAEETGLGAPLAIRLAAAVHPMPPRYVPDPRASDEAWAVTIPVHICLGPSLGLPAVQGGDDACRAQWVRAGSYEDLTGTLARDYGGTVFAAHAEMLREFLDGAS